MNNQLGRILLEESALICCTRNRPERVFQLLSFLDSGVEVPGLLLFVDSSDSRETQSICEQAWSNINPIWLSSQPGAPHQKNMGLDWLDKHAFNWSSAAVFFLDDDIEPDLGYFARSVEILNHSVNVGVLGGFDSSLKKERTFTFARRLLGLEDASPGGKLLRSGICTTINPSESLEVVDWVPGGMQTYRGLTIKNNRFDGRIRIYGDEVELQIRLSKEQNAIVATSKLLPVIHHGETIAKDSVALSESFMDGFRWSLAKRYPERVSKVRVLVTTVALLQAEAIFWAFTREAVHLERAKGHGLFLLRLIFRKEIQQFVSHSGSGPYV